MFYTRTDSCKTFKNKLSQYCNFYYLHGLYSSVLARKLTRAGICFPYHAMLGDGVPLAWQSSLRVTGSPAASLSNTNASRSGSVVNDGGSPVRSAIVIVHDEI